MPNFVFSIQVVSTVLMTGIIWFVQIVHYPLFAKVPDPYQAMYARLHQQRTGWVVGPLMLAELISSLALLRSEWRVPAISLATVWTGLGLLLAIWLSTALLQIPLHERLLAGFDAQAIGELVRTNWVRTIAWTLRAALVVYWLKERAEPR